MGADSLFSYSTLFGFLFTLARTAGVFAFLPLAVFRAMPEAAKIVLSLAFTLLLRSDWKAPAGLETSIARIVWGLANEMALGLAIGLALAIVLETFQFAAQEVSLAAGLGYASTIDPSSGADSTVLLTTASLLAGLFFFVSGADRVFVHALAGSLRLAPPESFAPRRSWAIAMGGFAASIFSVGLRLAGPVIGLVLLADFSLAVLGRVQSQLHLMSLTMPVKLAATMLLAALTVGLQPHIFESRMTDWVQFVEGLLRSAH
jgi:flagellar biosynthetic protein FliR